MIRARLVEQVDVQAARDEIAQKSEQEIERETADKWAGRALAAFEQYRRTEDVKWAFQAEDYRHEALEHAALVRDGGRTVASLSALIDRAMGKSPVSEARMIVRATLVEAGTSQGAKKGWAARKGGASSPPSALQHGVGKELRRKAVAAVKTMRSLGASEQAISRVIKMYANAMAKHAMGRAFPKGRTSEADDTFEPFAKSEDPAQKTYSPVQASLAEDVSEVTPPGYERIVKALKRTPGVKSPWAVAWSMKGKGIKPHTATEQFLGEWRRLRNSPRRKQYESLGEVTPPGWEGTVKRMKRHPDITNPWALAWWMKGQGYSPRKKSAEAGTSQGAKKGWASRKGGGSPQDKVTGGRSGGHGGHEELVSAGFQRLKKSRSAGSWHADLDPDEIPYAGPGGRIAVLNKRTGRWEGTSSASEAIAEMEAFLREAYMGFEKLKRSLAGKGAKDPGALAAYIGRKKYGKGAFQKAATKGKKMGKAGEAGTSQGAKKGWAARKGGGGGVTPRPVGRQLGRDATAAAMARRMGFKKDEPVPVRHPSARALGYKVGKRGFTMAEAIPLTGPLLRKGVRKPPVDVADAQDHPRDQDLPIRSFRDDVQRKVKLKKLMKPRVGGKRPPVQAEVA